MTNSTRLLGVGLAALGIALGLMCSVWSLSQPEGLGGRLFALMAAAVIVAPLLIAGVILYRRGEREEREAAGYTAARQTLERRRLAGGEWARRIDALTRRLEPGATDRAAREALTRLSLIADGLRDEANEAAALDVLAAEQPDRLKDLAAADASLDAELARLEERAGTWAGGGDPDGLLQAVDRLNRVFNQRQRLLARGTLPPVPSVAELLAPRASLGPGAVDLTTLSPGDAISYPGHDYLVVGRIEYEDAGQSWLGYRLRDGRQEALLLLEGGRLWLLDSTPIGGAEASVESAAAAVTVDGVEYRLRRSGTATATVAATGGRRPGVLVDYRRYEGAAANGASGLGTPGLWGERWDEAGAGWTLWRGEAVSGSDLDAWPRAHETT